MLPRRRLGLPPRRAVLRRLGPPFPPLMLARALGWGHSTCRRRRRAGDGARRSTWSCFLGTRSGSCAAARSSPHEMDYGGSDAHVSPRVHQHPPSANPFTNSSIQASTGLYGQATAGFAPRPSLSDQSKNTIFSNALSSPVRRSLQNYHLTQGAGNGGRNTEANSAGQNRETNSPSSNDTSMDMVSDSAGNEYY